MTNFEEKIKQEKKVFDSLEPGKEHLARFILKLEDADEKEKKKKSPFFFLKIAAIFILLLAVGYATFSYLIQKSAKSDHTRMIVYSSGLNQVMTYYDDVSTEKIGKIENYTTNSEEAKRIKKEASSRLEDIDISLAAIEKEYLKNPENEMLKAALINNKRKKVEVMDRIIMQMDVANTQLY